MSKLFESIIREDTLPQLCKVDVSNLTKKHLDIRYENEYGYSVREAHFDTNGDLFVTFDILSTFMDGQSVYAGYTDSDYGKYSIIVQFVGATSHLTADFHSLDANAKVQAITSIMNLCDVKLYSDDPSFYTQGFWEDLAQVGMSIYEFPGPIGTGKWHNIHLASGGLQNPYKRVTKHIAQLSQESTHYINDICKIL